MFCHLFSSLRSLIQTHIRIHIVNNSLLFIWILNFCFFTLQIREKTYPLFTCICKYHLLFHYRPSIWLIVDHSLNSPYPLVPSPTCNLISNMVCVLVHKYVLKSFVFVFHLINSVASFIHHRREIIVSPLKFVVGVWSVVESSLIYWYSIKLICK